MVLDAQHIETILAERGMTKAVLADLCQISSQNLSTIIRRQSCQPKTAGKIAAGLGIPVSEIIKH